jgi:hypothetical protein
MRRNPACAARALIQQQVEPIDAAARAAWLSFYLGRGTPYSRT